MANLFRSMSADRDGLPLVSGTAKGLGVRVNDDDPEIPYDEEGIVEPGTGGMSVTIDDPMRLPPWRRPPSFGGDSNVPLWVLDEDSLPEYLACRRDETDPYHGLIEPARTMELADYQTALAETRSLWRNT